MTSILPLVALALALAAPFVARRKAVAPDLARLGVLLGLVVAAAGVVARFAPAADRTPALVGLALGAVAALLGAGTGGLAGGVAAASALHLFPAQPSMGLAFVAATGLGAIAVGGEAAALAGVLVLAADDLGMRHSQLPAAAFVGSQAGIAVAVAALLAGLPKLPTWVRPILVALVVAVAGLFLARASGDLGLAYSLALGAVAGAVVHALMPGEEAESSRVGLAAVVGVALATVAFGLGRGAGMGLAALAAVGVLLALENHRAVLALGPLVGLVLYRVLREAGTGATRALDIAQHYTLLALILGLVLPLLPVDWLESREPLSPPAERGRGEGRGASKVGRALWGVVLLAAAPLVVAALGMRGGIGLVVGLGTTGLVQALRVEPSRREERRKVGSTGDRLRGAPRKDEAPLLALALGSGLAGSTILALAWLGDESTLSRDAKLHLFAYAAVGLVLVAGALAPVGRPKEEPS